MSEQEQETQVAPETDGDETTETDGEQEQETQVESHEPNDATTTTGDGEPLTDQEQGVGLAPTEPGDAGEGNPGTHFQTTEEIEAADLSKSGEVAGVQ